MVHLGVVCFDPYVSEPAKGLALQNRDCGSNLLCFDYFRYPHASATFLISSKKDMNLPILFQVPDVLSKVLNFCFFIEKTPTVVLIGH